MISHSFRHQVTLSRVAPAIRWPAPVAGPDAAPPCPGGAPVGLSPDGPGSPGFAGSAHGPALAPDVEVMPPSSSRKLMSDRNFATPSTLMSHVKEATSPSHRASFDPEWGVGYISAASSITRAADLATHGDPRTVRVFSSPLGAKAPPKSASRLNSMRNLNSFAAPQVVVRTSDLFAGSIGFPGARRLARPGSASECRTPGELPLRLRWERSQTS